MLIKYVAYNSAIRHLITQTDKKFHFPKIPHITTEKLGEKKPMNVVVVFKNSMPYTVIFFIL